MATDHVWTLRSALEQALVLYEWENFWAGHIATVRHVLDQPDEQRATIARLESELAEARDTAYQRGRSIDQMRAQHDADADAALRRHASDGLTIVSLETRLDAAQALAEARGRRVEELVSQLTSIAAAWSRSWDCSANPGHEEMCKAADAAWDYLAISSAAPPGETGSTPFVAFSSADEEPRAMCGCESFHDHGEHAPWCARAGMDEDDDAPPPSPSLGQRIGAAVDTRCLACGMVDASPVCLSCGAAK